MELQELHDRGMKLRVDMFGREAVDKRMNALGEFGKPLQHIVNAYAYGDVWSRSVVPAPTKSLAMIAMAMVDLLSGTPENRGAISFAILVAVMSGGYAVTGYYPESLPLAQVFGKHDSGKPDEK